jgi:prepilin-type N-terminal cleavage/methylation domain-containing protein
MKFSISHFQRRRADEKNPPVVPDLNSRRAFTLIEIMVSIVIFSLVIAAICATLMLIIRATTVGQAAAARAQRQRVVMDTLENSLMCIQSFQASPQYYSFIAQGGEQPLLSFVARLPAVFPRNSKFINLEEGRDFNLRRVTFTLEPGPDRQNNLVLRQKPLLMDMDETEQKNPLVLAQDVKTFSIECWDTNQLDWIKEWDNTNALPPMVRIGLVLGNGDNNNDNNSDADSQRVIVRAFSLPSTMMPTVVQMGGLGGFGRPPGIVPPVQPPVAPPR